MIGERLGKWIIYKELGRGGMGKVYLAQEEIGGKQAALKVLAPELAQESGFLKRFQREIETLGQLDHPHIVRLFDSGYENGHYFYAMEFVDGPSLDSVLEKEKRLHWKDVLEIALQVCPALKHVHDHGVIHRDLKPANILRDSAGVIKLTDFGIAKVFAHGHLTATGGVIGTAEYLSPEQALGKPVTKRSDLYSLGVVFYTLLTGKPPFSGESFVELLHKHRYAQFDPPRKIVPGLPYELDELVCTLLEKDPADRPPDCLVLSRQLESIRAKLERKNQPTYELSSDAGTVAENKEDSEAGPGPATMMSRLVREELDRINRGGPISQLLNRWYVVVPLLLAVIGIFVWTFWPASAESLYERGATLMASSDPADWDRAWREYLEPLERNHPGHAYKKEIEGFRKKIDAHHLTEMDSPPPEGRRLYEVGEQLRKEGKYTDARRVWTDLATAFKNVESEKEWVAKADQGIASIDRMAADKQRLAPVWAALDQAAALRNEGKIEQANAIWNGIQELYRNDPAAAEIMDKIKSERGK